MSFNKNLQYHHIFYSIQFYNNKDLIQIPKKQDHENKNIKPLKNPILEITPHVTSQHCNFADLLQIKLC